MPCSPETTWATWRPSIHALTTAPGRRAPSGARTVPAMTTGVAVPWATAGALNDDARSATRVGSMKW